MADAWHIVQTWEVQPPTGTWRPVMLRLHHGGTESIAENRQWKERNKTHAQRIDKVLDTAPDLDGILQKFRRYLREHGERVKR